METKCIPSEIAGLLAPYHRSSHAHTLPVLIYSTFSDRMSLCLKGFLAEGIGEAQVEGGHIVAGIP